MKSKIIEYSKKKWLILLLISACLCTVPAIYHRMSQTKSAFALTTIVFILQWALVIWFGICVIKDAKAYSSDIIVRWYQKMARIIVVVITLAIIYFAFMNLELKSYNPAYMVEAGFWETNKMTITGSLLYGITINVQKNDGT